MPPVEVKLEGATTAAKAIADLDYKMRRNIVQASVRAGMGEIRRTARQLAPQKTGLLKRQLSVSVKTDRVSGTTTGILKAKRTKSARRKGVKHSGNYLHLVVGGTKPHIQAGMINRRYYTRIEHPGAKAQPFMDEAVSMAFGAALAAFTSKMDERLLKAIAEIHAAQRVGRE